MHYLKHWRQLKRESQGACNAPCGAPVFANDSCMRHQHAAFRPAHTSAQVDEYQDVAGLANALARAIKANAQLRKQLADLRRARILDCARMSPRGRALRGGSAAGS